MSTRALVTSLALGGIACGKSTPPPPPAESATAAPADSLVATAPGGAEIWFTLARADSGGAGRCTARAVEIRRGSTRIPVPLLSDHCLAGDAYLVNLRTGRPVREHP